MKPRALKIAVAGLYHETNTFAPGTTGLTAFSAEYVLGSELFYQRYEHTQTSMGGVIAAARSVGADLAVGLYTAATPSGMVETAAAEALLSDIVHSIDDNIDGLILILHGAMVGEAIPDMEAELLGRLRERMGVGLPIAVTLDLHANISVEMTEKTDILVGYDTYPHVDMFDRAAEAFQLLVRMIQGEIRPVRAFGAANMLVIPQGMLTDQGMMKEVMGLAFAIENDNKVLNVTVAGGFPYSDVPAAGMSFVVTTDGDEGLAKYYAASLVQAAWSRREGFTVSFVPPADAVALAAVNPEGPVILTDGSDNVGGGAPGDATHILQHLTNLPCKSLIVMCDPQAAQQAHEIGTGGVFHGQVGGRHDTLHGQPVELKGQIRLLFDGLYHHVGPYMTGQLADMGRTAVIVCGNLTVVVTEKRTPPWDLGHLRYIGIWPEDYHIIVVKSAIAWQTALGAFAKRVIHVDTPGCCSANLSHFDYQYVKRPIYPLDKQA
ncbi:M81 family metallopeptidase [Paenibacillus periandrae]|uniref:M81 family metallopeptidase n=1 Tax=Paenibacillus periandrae TaxID=1761741 RepID=UPI001F09906C